MEIEPSDSQMDKHSIVSNILRAIGEDPNREGLIDTPSRVIKSWKELYGGYVLDPNKVLQRRFSTEDYDQMVLLRDIEFFSTCEHHMLPFFGKAHIAYIPDKHVVGLSKLARLVECFSRRLQIQERLTKQIAETLWQELSPLGVGVVIEAKHFCMISRGINKQNSIMVTTSLQGIFKTDDIVRNEFLRSVYK